MVDALPEVKLHKLIQDVAGKLGDSMMFEATDGDTSTFVDTLSIPIGNINLNRSQFMPTSGDNEGIPRRITDTDQTGSSITVSPPWDASIVAGDTGFVVNIRNSGFSFPEYKQHINMAITGSRGIARTNLVSSTMVVDSSTGILTVPTTMDEVYALEWQDVDGITWRPLESGGSGLDGWWFDQPEGVITLDPMMADYYNGTTVRIRGQGSHPELASYTDTTTLHPKWVCSQAAYTLSMMGIDRDVHGSRARQVLQFQQDAQQEMALIRTRHKPTSVSIRS